MAPGDLPYFDRMAPVYDLFMPAADAETFAAAFDRADRPIERVLDVGGGTGRAARAIDAPRRVVFDASAEMLARVPEEIETVRGDALEEGQRLSTPVFERERARCCLVAGPDDERIRPVPALLTTAAPALSAALADSFDGPDQPPDPLRSVERVLHV